MCSDESSSECAKKCLCLEKLIAPCVIKVAFWLGVVVVFCLGVKTMVTEDFAGGLILMVLGPVAVRVVAEFLLMPFKMLEAVTAIKNAQGPPNPACDKTPPTA